MNNVVMTSKIICFFWGGEGADAPEERPYNMLII